MNHHLVIVLLSVTVLAVGCAARSTNSNHRAAEAFRAQLDDDWKYWMSQYPEMATAFGYPGQNMHWTDYSQPAIDARAEYLRKSFDRLKGIDRAELDGEDQVNYDLYQDLLGTAVKGLDFHNDANPIKGVIPHNLLMPMNQLEGIQQDIPRTFAMMPKASREDYENIVLRLERVAPLIDQTIGLMEQGVAAKMTPPKVTFRDVPAQVQAQIFDDPAKSPLLDAFKVMPQSISEADAGPLKDRAIAAYKGSVRPALTKLHGFLVNRYWPACRESTDAASL